MLTKCSTENSVSHEVSNFHQTISQRILCLLKKVDLAIVSVDMVVKSADHHLRIIALISTKGVCVGLLKLIVAEHSIQLLPKVVSHQSKNDPSKHQHENCEPNPFVAASFTPTHLSGS